MRVRPLGDSALIVELGAAADADTRRRVHACSAQLAAASLEGVLDIVPGLATVGVHYDPARVRRAGSELPHVAIARAVERELAEARDAGHVTGGRTIEIAVCYDTTVAPDLDDVARHAGMTPDEVIAVHAGGSYVVHMIGFLPGFPYLDGLDPRLTIPRRTVPRTKVPAGSVAIGGQHTGIYPLESPGGWQIIGRTSVRLFAADRNPPTLLRAGDTVRFRRVSLDELETGAM